MPQGLYKSTSTLEYSGFILIPIKSRKYEREDRRFILMGNVVVTNAFRVITNTDNEKIIKEAKNERDNLLKDARQVKDKIISEAKQKANLEAKKILEDAKGKIESEKDAALDEIKNQVAGFSIEIAEKILKKELEKSKDQKNLIDELIDDIKIN